MNRDTILQKTVKYILQLPDGADLTTAQAIKAACSEEVLNRNSNIDLLTLHSDIVDAVEQAGTMCLDFSSHENRLEGLPFNLDFIVRKK